MSKAKGVFGCCGCLVITGGLSLFCLVAILSMDVDSLPGGRNAPVRTPEQLASDGKLGAWVATQGFVKQKLVSPSSASFPRSVSTDNLVESLGNDEYRIRSTVEAKNAFGVKI